MNLNICTNRTKTNNTCGNFISLNGTYDFLEYTSNITLPVFNLSQGFNYVDKSVFGGNILITDNLIPVLITNSIDDLVSIPIDFSSAATYQDFTFTQLDTTNKRLISLKKIYKKNQLRFYVNIKYRKNVNVYQFSKSFNSVSRNTITIIPLKSYINKTYQTINIIEDYSSLSKCFFILFFFDYIVLFTFPKL